MQAHRITAWHVYLGRTLPLAAVIVIRRALGVPEYFHGEFLIEDFILLLMLVLPFAPRRLQAAIWRVIGSATMTVMALIFITTGAHRLPTAEVAIAAVFFSGLALWSAVLAVIEVLQLRKQNVNGVSHP